MAVLERTNLEGIWRRLARKATGKISRGLIRAIIAALIYHIWQAQNGALWNKAVVRPMEIMKESKGSFMSRIYRLNLSLPEQDLAVVFYELKEQMLLNEIAGGYTFHCANRHTLQQN